MATTKKANLDPNYEESIRNYASEIEVITDFAEAVRRLPGQYIGSKNATGWKNCIREIFQNAFDECVRAKSPCHYVRVVFDERNQSAIIEDEGRGIPHGRMIEIYSTQHSSSNYTKNKYEYTSGIHGVGSGVAMALSKKFIVESHQLGECHRIEFDSGKLWKHGEKKVKATPGRQGTNVYMEPDLDILDDVNLTSAEVFELIRRIYPMSNIGDRFDFTGIDKNGVAIINERLINQDGPMGILMLTTQKPLMMPITASIDNGDIKADICFTWDLSAITESEDIASFGNFSPTTDGGTHVDGFIDGLSQFMRNYMNKIYLGEKSKITVIGNDVKAGLKAVVSAATLNPVFAGQFKGILTSAEVKPFVKALTIGALEAFAKDRAADLQKLCKYIKEVAEVRAKSDDTKIKLTANYEQSALGGYPKKFVRPSAKKDIEFFIVEGDSALSGLRNGRDTDHQGIFPIRGKLPNAFTTSRQKFLQNQEVSAIIKLTTGESVYKKDFNVKNCKWSKIIILADADPDGYHIRTLVLKLFLMYMPQIIEAGILYAAVPPLYSVKQGKKNVYFTTRMDFAKYIQSVFNKSHTLSTMSGKKLTPAEAVKLFYQNADYAYDMGILSKTFAVHPILLEQVLFHLADNISFEQEVSAAGFAKATAAKNVGVSSEEVKDYLDKSIIQAVGYSLEGLNYNKFKKAIEKQFRFMKVSKVNGTIVVSGEFEEKSNQIILNNYFVSGCIDMINAIRRIKERVYKLDGNPATMYTIMDTFDSIMPDVKRYKGLGEMNSDEAAESTTLPANRTLIQYTLESAKEEIEAIRFVDNNVSSILSTVHIRRQDVE